MDLELNKTVYVVWNQIFAPKEVTITKIGRKYAHTNDPRIVIDIERMTCGSAPTVGMIFESKEVYESKTQKDDLWSEVRKQELNTHTRPQQLSTQQLEDLLKLLS